MNVELKNVAKANLIAESRLLAGVVQRFPGTTNAMHIDLMLTPRDVQPTPIPPPGIFPTILIKSVLGRTVNIRLIDASEPTRRAGRPGSMERPFSVTSARSRRPPSRPGSWKAAPAGWRHIPVVFPNTVVAVREGVADRVLLQSARKVGLPVRRSARSSRRA